MALDLTHFARSEKVGGSAARLSEALSEQERRRRRGGRRRVGVRMRTIRLGGVGTRWTAGRDRSIRVPVPEARYEPVEPLEIYGAGVILLGREEPRPVIFASRRITESSGEEPVDLADEPAVGRRAAGALGSAAPPGTVVLAVRSPVAQFAAGERSRGPGTRGTFGPCVTTDDGRPAILTAGHVAEKGQVVRDPADRSGVVSFSVSPTRATRGQIVADVAVVVPHEAGGLGRLPRYAPAGPVDGGATITMEGAESGTRTDEVWAAAKYVWGDNCPGQWKDVVLTTQVISERGDSGAPVVLEGTDRLVGHLVGAVPGKGSLVQDLDCILAASGTALR